MVWRYACGFDIILRLIFVTCFRILNLVMFSGLNSIKAGALCAHLLLQFYADLF